MNLKLPVLSAALILTAASLHAQVSAYTFSQSIGSYGSPTTGTVINTPLTGDEAIAETLPFTFTFNGTPYTNMNVCSNGFLSFSSITGSEYFAISDPSTSNVIAPLSGTIVPITAVLGDITAGSNTISNCSSVAGYSVGDILIDIWGDFGGDPTITAISGNNIIVNMNSLNTFAGNDIVAYGTITKGVSGTAPNRVLELEYRHMSRLNIFEDVNYDEVIDFKVRLYETTNKIEFIYRASPGSDPVPGHEIGLKGGSISDYNTREVIEGTNTWNTSTASNAVTDFCELSNTLFPAEGQSYAWLPSCLTPTLSVSQTPSLTCPGFQAVLTASGATNYTWTAGPATAQYSISPNNTTSYTLTGANDVCTASLVVTHSVIPGPVLNVTSSNNSSCAGLTATLVATGATSYTWTNGPQTSLYAVSPSVTTVYTVTGSNGGACNALFTFTQNVIQYPVLGIIQPNPVICEGTSAVLTATGATTYSWSSGQSSAQVTVSPAANTVYTVTGNNQSCASTATIMQNVTVCTSIQDASLEHALSVYPNPFRSELNLKNSSDSELSIRISDALGKTVYSGVLKGNSSGNITTSELGNGIYILQLSNGSQSHTRKLVKTN